MKKDSHGCNFKNGTVSRSLPIYLDGVKAKNINKATK